LLVLCIGNFLILLDSSVVNTAAPDMMRSLHTGVDSFLWVLNSYLLALAALLIVAGRLGTVLGPRAVFTGGLAVFAVASMLCGVAQSPGQLIAARILQGMAAAALLPQPLTLIVGIFPANRQGAAFGIFTAVAGVAAVSGPTLGGVIITYFGWQWIFYLNVPICAAGVVLTQWLVPDVRGRRARYFDLTGMILATAGLVGVVYALIEGERHHWGTVRGPVTIPGLLVVSVLLLAAFVGWERRHREPLVPLSLFGRRNFSVATTITLLTSFALFGFLLIFVIETQTLLGMSAVMSGVTALPWTITLSAVAPVAGRLTDRIGGRRLLVGGLLVYVLGVLAFARLPTPHSSPATFVVPLVLIGIGMGAAIAPATTEAMRDGPADDAGAASGVLNTARQVGAALGAATVGAMFQHRLTGTLHEHALAQAAQLPGALRPGFTAGFAGAARHGLGLGSGQHGGVSVPAGLPPALADRYGRAIADTFSAAFLPAARPALYVVTGALLIAAVLAGLLRTTRRAAGAPADDLLIDTH
jgi:EmrB/QacA subfamily drug resistance transporter